MSADVKFNPVLAHVPWLRCVFLRWPSHACRYPWHTKTLLGKLTMGLIHTVLFYSSIFSLSSAPELSLAVHTLVCILSKECFFEKKIAVFNLTKNTTFSSQKISTDSAMIVFVVGRAKVYEMKEKKTGIVSGEPKKPRS